MTNYDVPVVRVVVEGCPSAGSTETNVPEASKMLLQAFSNEEWPGNAMFAIAPGGFITGPLPKRWDGNRGWSSCPEDFQELVGHAEGLVSQVLTRQILEAARTRAEFLTLGVDLADWSRTRTHAEAGRHCRCQPGQASPMDRQIVPCVGAGTNAGPGNESGIAPARMRNGSHSRLGVPRSEHVQSAGQGQHEGWQPEV